jgi:hypothetical protein
VLDSSRVYGLVGDPFAAGEIFVWLLSSLILLQLVGVVVKTFGEAYPELVKHQDNISRHYCRHC